MLMQRVIDEVRIRPFARLSLTFCAKLLALRDAKTALPESGETVGDLRLSGQSVRIRARHYEKRNVAYRKGKCA